MATFTLVSSIGRFIIENELINYRSLCYSGARAINFLYENNQIIRNVAAQKIQKTWRNFKEKKLGIKSKEETLYDKVNNIVEGSREYLDMTKTYLLSFYKKSA